MMQNLSLRERRLVALGILAALIALAWFLVATPILNGFAERREAREVARASLAHDAQLVAALPRIRQDAARARTELARYAIVAASPAAAAEAARARLAALVAGAGGVLDAVRQQSAGATSLRYQVDLHADLPRLAALLRRLQSEAPLGAVAALSVSTDPAGAAALPLRVRLDVVYACLLPS